MPRIAMISTAHIHSKSFLQSIAELSSTGRAEVIWDDNPARGRAYAEQFGCRFEPSLQAVAADKAVDGFVVCAENTRHMALLEQVLPAGKPVLCEKPLATTVPDARAIAALVRKHGTTLLSGYVQPFSAAHRGVKKLLADGADGRLGKVTHANFRNAHHAAYGRWFDSPELAWFTQPDLSGGGALLDMGTHAVHLLRHLFGPVREVFSVQANVSGEYPAVDDYGLILMRFAGGVIGRVEAGWVFTGGHRGLEIIGSTRSLWNSSATGESALVLAGPKEQPQPVPPGEARPDRIARLVGVIHEQISQSELDEDLVACLDSVSIMSAAYASGKSGVWESVETI